MSAQFIDIYEIGTDAPIITSTDQKPLDKDPLNLSLTLKGNNITIRTGLDDIFYQKYKFTELAKLNKALIELKKKNPKEVSVIIKPHKNFSYSKIISIIDHATKIKEDNVFITAIDSKNRKVPSTKLFATIIFDTQD